MKTAGRWLWTGMLLAGLLAGCEDSAETRLQAERQKQITKLEEENTRISGELQALRGEAQLLRQESNTASGKLAEKDFQIQQLTAQKQKMDALTAMQSFEWEAAASLDTPSGKEKVVYVKNVPDSAADKEIYLLRAALEFTGDPSARVTFWNNRDRAMQYASKDYNPEETLEGWSGFDSRFGLLLPSKEKPKLTLYLGRHDAAMVEFGSFHSKE